MPSAFGQLLQQKKLFHKDVCVRLLNILNFPYTFSISMEIDFKLEYNFPGSRSNNLVASLTFNFFTLEAIPAILNNP